MLEDFPKWYLEVDHSPTGELIDCRWAGVEQFSEALASKLDLNAVELATGGQGQTDGILDAFRKHDSAFVADKNKNELAILAASAIANLYSSNSHLATSYAIAVECHSFSGNRKFGPTSWIQHLAQAYIAKTSDNLRSKKNTIQPLPILPSIVRTSSEDAESETDLVFSELEKIVAAFNRTSSQFNLQMKHFEKMNALYEEELDILWWLFGESTMECCSTFNSFDFKELIFVVAKEIASFVKILPGPYAVQSFVRKALETHSSFSDSKIVLQTAINKVGDDFKKGVTEDFDEKNMARVCPVHCAFRKALETGQWGASFQSTTGFDPKLRITPINLSMQFYWEILAQRCFAEGGA